jgi:hypothetical protein
VIWRRHYIEERFVDGLHKLLVEIPESLDVHAYLPWLKEEVVPLVKRTEERYYFQVTLFV